MIALLKSLVRAYAGGIKHQAEHRRLLRSVPSVNSVLEYATDRWPAIQSVRSTEAPIFILASSWRAGSTALQRLIMSSGEVLVWGEPYRDSNYIQMLADSLKPLSATHPREQELNLAESGERLSEQWVATLSPAPTALKAAHVNFLHSLLAVPAGELGYKRWGLKETRLEAEHLRYLEWLFPKARFVLLHRNPYQAYRSYRVFETWYSRWPNEPVMSARDFGRHWRRLTSSFLEVSGQESALLVGYDRLGGDSTQLAKDLSKHLEIKIASDVLDHIVTGRVAGSGYSAPPTVPAPEMAALRLEVSDVAEQLGYSVPRDEVKRNWWSPAD